MTHCEKVRHRKGEDRGPGREGKGRDKKIIKKYLCDMAFPAEKEFCLVPIIELGSHKTEFEGRQLSPDHKYTL